MKRCPNHWYRAVFAALLMTLMTLSAFAQIQTGSIIGTVVDKDNAALPGVTVTLSGPGAPQTDVTDAQGRFRFASLTPGTYSLRAELAGFGQANRSGIGVRIGGTSDIALTLNPSVSQTITVTAEAPLLDVRKTGTGATMTKVEMEVVPSGRDPWVMLQQTPGVLMDRINVGGNESGQQSTYVSKGVTSDQTAWNVDGVNITDVGALGSSPTYYDFDSFEEIQITTGGTDVRIQTPGAQINMVTKRGTNDLSGSGRYFMTSGDFQSDPEIPTEATSYLGSVNEIDEITDMGIEAGGPIIRDRLWLWGAYSLQNIDLFVGQPFGQAVRYTDKTELETYNLKLNAQPIAANSLSFAAMLGNKVKLGRNVGPTRPPATAWNQDSNYSGPTMWKIEDTHVFSSNFYLTGLYSKVQGGFQLISDNGKGCQTIECGLGGTPAYLDLTATNPNGTPYALSGAWQNSFYNYYTERPQDQARLDGSAFFNTGTLSHELKFGFGYRDAEVLSQSGWPGQQYMVFYGDAFGSNYGRPGEIDAFAGAYLLRNADFTYNVNSTDLYVGDTMMFGNLTLQAGLRWDMQEGTVNSGTIGANAVAGGLLPALTFNGDSIGSLEWNSVSPRLGLTYALGAEKKTLLRAAANRYHDQLGGFTVYGASPLGYQYMYFYFTDANGNRRADVGEVDTSTVLGYLGLDPKNPGSSVPVRRWDPDMKVPHTDELLFGLERELLSDFVVGATVTWRKLNDFIETRAEKTRGSNNFYTPADFQAPQNLTCTPATQNCGPFGSGYTVQYQRLRSDVAPPTFFVFTNAPDYHQTYQGLELTGTKRMSNRWMMRASVTLQDWKQHVGDGYITDPTRQRSGSGCSTCDDSPVLEGSGAGSGAKGGIYINSKWAYNLTGAYQLPLVEASLGFNLTGRQGYPIPYVARSPYLASEQAYKYVLVPEDPTEYRHEDIHNLDLRLAKDFRFGGVGTTLSVDLFNVLNAQPVLQRNTRLNYPAANRITELQSPRVFRLGARLTF